MNCETNIKFGTNAKNTKYGLRKIVKLDADH